MTTALDLVALRYSSGIDRSDLTALLDVSERRWRRWEAGTEPVPAGVIADLATLEARTAQAVAKVVDEWASSETGEPIRLGPRTDNEQFWADWPEYRPLPASWWWVVADRARRYGVPVEVA